MKEEKYKKLHNLLVGQKLAAGILDQESGRALVSQGRTVRVKDLNRIVEKGDLENIKVNNPETEQEIARVTRLLDSQIEELTFELEREIATSGVHPESRSPTRPPEEERPLPVPPQPAASICDDDC